MSNRGIFRCVFLEFLILLLLLEESKTGTQYIMQKTFKQNMAYPRKFAKQFSQSADIQPHFSHDSMKTKIPL
jgi:hypothetical protein